MKVRLPRNLWVFLAYLGLSLIWYARVLPPDRFFVGYDLEAAGYADRAFVAEGLRQGEIRFWNPYVLGGMPTFAGLMLEFFSPTRPLWLFMDVEQVFKLDFILASAFAAFFAFLLMRTLGVAPVLAFAGGIAAGFSWIPSLAFAGHTTRAYVLAWFWGLLWILYRGVIQPRLLTFTIAGGIMALMLWAQHVQMAYYAYGAATIWVVGLSLHRYAVARDWRALTRVFLLFSLSVGLSLWMGVAQWLPGLEYVREWSIRSGAKRSLEFAASWSASWQDLISVWFPKFSGLSVGQNTYWGENAFRHDLAYGSVLAILGAVAIGVLWQRVRSRNRIPGVVIVLLVEIGVFSLISVGDRTPAFSIFYHGLPFFKVLRAHAMALAYVAAFALLLGVWGVHQTLTFPHTRKMYGAAAAVFALFGLGILLFPEMFSSLLAGLFGVDAQRKILLRAALPTIGRSGLWIAAVTGLMAWSPRWGLVSLPILVGVELFMLTRPMLQPAPSMRARMDRDPIIRAVQDLMDRDEIPSRVLPLGYRTADNNWERWGIATAGGMFPFMPRTYAEWIGTQGFVLNLLSFQNFYIRPELADLTGVSVVVAPSLPDSATLERRYRDHPQYTLLMALARFTSRLEPVSRLTTSQGPVTVYRNPHTSGMLAFYTRSRIIPGDSTGVRHILTSSENLHKVLLLSDSTASEISTGDSSTHATIRVHSFRAGAMSLEISTTRKGYLMVAQNYHPQWKAWVDGTPAPVYRAFHTFMAIPIDAGDHEVVLQYVPSLERRAWLIGGLGVLFWVGLIGIEGTRAFRRRKASGHPSIHHE